MKRSEFVASRLAHWRLGQDVGAARGPYNAERNAECDALAAEAAGVKWEPETSVVAERARIRRELLAVEHDIMWGAHPSALRLALDRICPEEG